MKISVLDIKGNKVEEITLKKEIFGAEPHEEAMAQYLRVYNNNQRQGTSATKTRGEVSGGGIKPWRQKGTGRARVGSSRNPVWRHGGVSHGPQPRSWNLNLPKKIRNLAFISALSYIAKNDKIKVLEGLNIEKPSTKEVQNILNNLKVEGKTLIVLNAYDPKVLKSASNIRNVKTSFTGILNAYDLLNAKNIVFVKDAVLALEKKYESK